MHRFTKEVLFQQRQQEKGIRVGLKPTVNCKDGTWRAYISFFEHDVPCEPKWENWFASYVEFQTHYARIAEEDVYKRQARKIGGLWIKLRKLKHQIY